MLKKTKGMIKENLLGVIQILGGLYILGFILIGVSNMFMLMGEIWGMFSIFWFGALGCYVFYENLYHRRGKKATEMLDNFLVVAMKFPILVGLTFGAGVLAEHIRVLNPMLGWSLFLVVNIVIFHNNVLKNVKNI